MLRYVMTSTPDAAYRPSTGTASWNATTQLERPCRLPGSGSARWKGPLEPVTVARASRASVPVAATRSGFKLDLGDLRPVDGETAEVHDHANDGVAVDRRLPPDPAQHRRHAQLVQHPEVCPSRN